MKRISNLGRVGALLVAGSLAPACDGFGDLLTYSFDVESEVTVPGTGIGITNPLAPADVFPANFGDLMAQELEQSFSTNDIDAAAVESVKITAMRIEVTNPEENGRVVRHLAFLASLAFDASAGELSPIRVAESEDGAFDDEVIAYDFPVTENELAGLLAEGGDITMATTLATDPPPDDRPTFDTDVKFTAVVTVEANPQGALSAAASGAGQ